MDTSFEDKIRALIKAKLSPDTQDIIDRKAGVDAQYFGDPTLLYDEVGDIQDPAAKRRLVEAKRQTLSAASNSMKGMLDARDANITDLVTSFANARKEQTAMEDAAFNRKMQLEDLAIKRQNAATSAAAASKENQTLAEQIQELIAAGYTPEQARTIAASSITGGDATQLDSYINPVANPNAVAGASTGPSYLGAAAKGLGTKFLVGTAAKKLGASALGGPAGWIAGGLMTADDLLNQSRGQKAIWGLIKSKIGQ